MAIPSSDGLAVLETALTRDFRRLAYPGRDWVRGRTGPDGKPALDVLVIGAGQGGLGVAHGLMRERVTNLLVIDGNEEGFAGPWRTFARMITLRTPKYLTGPDWGVSNLTFRAWYEAQYGDDGWEKLALIPKELWAECLNWYRRFLKIPTLHKTWAGAIHWDAKAQLFAVPLRNESGEKWVYTRKVVLATGIDGSGRWEAPREVAALPKALCAHTHDPIDFTALRGKRIGILGAGASAFDNASVALETGAGEVHLFYRRDKLPNVNPYRWAEFVGFLKHHGDLPDAERWRFVRKILQMGQLPPHDTFHRATGQKHFHLHSGSPWLTAEARGNAVHVTTPKGAFTFDFVILGSGFVTDISLRPELKELHPHIALWRDKFSPPATESHDDLARHPYLGSSFEFREKTPGEAPYLQGVFNYTFGCLLSLGFGGGSISGLKYSLPKIVGGITRQLYCDDHAAYYDALCNYREPEFQP